MTATTVATVAERVAAGADWLDVHHPGWVDRIDPGRLDLANCELCIIGQLYGDYAAAVADDDALTTAPSGLRDSDAAELGMEHRQLYSNDYDDAAVAEDYTALNAAWRKLIAARRDGAR